MESCRQLRLFIALVAATLAMSQAAVTPEMRQREFLRHLRAIDVDSILLNNRLVDKYIKCLLKTGKCDPSMRDLRISLPLILQHMCDTKCTGKEKINLRKLFVYIRTNRRPEWDRLVKLYDPRGVHKKKMMAFMFQGARTGSTTNPPLTTNDLSANTVPIIR